MIVALLSYHVRFQVSVSVWRSFVGGRLVELVVGLPRPSQFGLRCTYRRCPCREPLKCSFLVSCSLCLVSCSLCLVSCSLCLVCCSLCLVCCSLCVVRCSLFIVRCVLCVVCCVLCVVSLLRSTLTRVT